MADKDTKAEEKKTDEKKEVAQAATKAAADADKGITQPKADQKGPVNLSAENQEEKAGDNDMLLEAKDEETPKAAILSDSAGGSVISNAPLLKGIPVILPLTDALRALGYDESHLVEGVASAAPIVEGIPEMHSNAQAINQFAAAPPETETIVAVHDLTSTEGIVQIDYVDTDGKKRSKRHHADAGTMRDFNNQMLEAKDAEDSQKLMKKFFGDKKRFNKDTLAE